MRDVNRQSTRPLSVPRTTRRQRLSVLTSIPAGKFTPLAVIPMLREDALAASVNVAVEMLETSEILMNRVSLRVRAFCVPWLASPRFEGSRDQFDRSYMGQPQVEGGDVIPFFPIGTLQAGSLQGGEVYKYLGLHAAMGDSINGLYVEGYNQIWNYLAKNRSPNIAERLLSATQLAPAFWDHSQFGYVVPDFDQAVIDGEVALNIVDARVPVRGLGKLTQTGTHNNVEVFDAEGSKQWQHAAIIDANYQSTDHGKFFVHVDADDPQQPGVVLPQIFAELQENGITVSLANIELARKTQAFAKLRERFDGHDEEWIIDMLMSGLTIPDQHLKQPILLADRRVPFTQAKRYATDSGNLAESAVSGGAMVSLNVRVPRINTGGVVFIIAECVPEQLFERQADPFLHVDGVEALPDYLRDELDPEKVDVVENREIDVIHSEPGGTFGYAPLNWKWAAGFGARVGGKFYRPNANATNDEERARLWAVETVDPVLGEDFYLVNNMHTKPFLDTMADPFEAVVRGEARIEGNTVFGPALIEARDNYDKVMAKAPAERIDKGDDE